MDKKNILVLARYDPIEAMRVAAGLTIYGHAVRFIFMTRALTEAEASSEHAELLELSDVTPETTVAAMRDQLPFLEPAGLTAAIRQADLVVSV